MSVRTKPPNKRAGLESTSLCAVVRVTESRVETWKEVGEVVSVSAAGAGFTIKRKCRIGGLVSLTMPLPVHLRSHDRNKELYNVWGLVQHCHKVASDDGNRYQVGVAFVGKEPPPSFAEKPKQAYRICGMNPDGLWKIEEAKSPFTTRKHARFSQNIDHYLVVMDENSRATASERTTTSNISKSGAAVNTTLDIGIGERVQFVCEKYEFSALAVVCNRQEGETGKPTRLHLQFVGNTFPIELIYLPEAIVEAA